MFRMIDRVVARLVPRANVAAGSTYRWCEVCSSTRARLYVRTCCLNEGCSTVDYGCGSC